MEVRNFVFLSIVLLVTISNFTDVQAKEKTVLHVESGKRSTIVEVDGYAYLSEDKTIKEMREEALVNAKREALERAQTFIQSISKVENFQLSYDFVQSQAEGAICILESRDHGITNDNRYHYWIKAELEYSLKPPEGKAELTSGLAKNPGAPLTVDVWTTKTEYQEGDQVQIFLRGNKDFYARVLYRNAEGNLLQLLPNPHRQENFFEGGKVITIPDEGDRFDLEVSPPFGVENIVIYASSVEMGDVDVEAVGDVVYSVHGGLEDYGMKTRGVKIIHMEAGERAPGAEFYEAKCEVKTRR